MHELFVKSIVTNLVTKRKFGVIRGNPHHEVRSGGKVQNAALCYLPLDLNSEQDSALGVIGI
jgi:hypothetical protein